MCKMHSMSIGQTLSAATVLTLLSGHQPILAADYLVQIGGAEGTPFGGTCLVMTGDTHANHEAKGTVPRTLEFSGDLISCAIQKRGGNGDLRIVIKDTGGRIVAQSSSVQPFGVVMAGGR